MLLSTKVTEDVVVLPATNNVVSYDPVKPDDPEKPVDPENPVVELLKLSS